MRLRYKYRLYPTSDQQRLLGQAFGCARVVFNDALRLRQDAYTAGRPYPTDGEISRNLTLAKRTPERAWLSDVSSVVLQQALADLNTACRNFFRSQSGRRAGARVGPPKFRSRKDSRQSIRFSRAAQFVVTDAHKLRLPKIGDVKVRWSRPLPSEPTSVTIIKDSADRYFASFVVETFDQALPTATTAVGIDLGLRTFAVLSDGTVVNNPRLLRKAERRLRKAQKALQRKTKGSQNRLKARRRLAIQHARVADARRDFAHKTSMTIVRENQAIFVEDLCVRGMMRTRLAKSVHDAGWGTFTRLLAEKSERFGRHFGKVDRFFPSTRICHVCGAQSERKPLGVRTWTCPCGATHDRDLNAAKNILAAGLAERRNACGAQVRPGLVPAQRNEAGTDLSTPGGQQKSRPPRARTDANTSMKVSNSSP